MATKKTFKNVSNPALQFISGAETEAETPAKTIAEREETAKAPEGYKVNPLYIETRSKRLQLVVQPSLYEKVKAKAEGEGVSVNEYIHHILENATKEEN